MQAMEISRTALNVEWQRMEVCAENLANMNSTRIGKQALYRSKTLISGPRADFSSHLDIGNARTDGIALQSLGGVAVYGIETSNLPPRLVHEPGNPQADSHGMVAYPNVDHAAQMLLMVKTSRAYEADMVAMNAARAMYTKALSLGGRS